MSHADLAELFQSLVDVSDSYSLSRIVGRPPLVLLHHLGAGLLGDLLLRFPLPTSPAASVRVGAGAWRAAALPGLAQLPLPAEVLSELEILWSREWGGAQANTAALKHNVRSALDTQLRGGGLTTWEKSTWLRSMLMASSICVC